MPYKPRHPCTYPACPELTHNRYCERHGDLEKREQQRYDRQRGTASSRGYTARWGRLRKHVLMSEPLCRRCHVTGRAEIAVLVHHKDHDPKNNEPDNLEPLCIGCHDEEHKAERWGKRMGFQIPVDLICGPPGCGKNHYIKKHFQYGDLIVDMDLLYQACSTLSLYEKPDDLLPFVCEARDAITNRLQRSSKIRKAWIITTDPTKHDYFRQLGARVIVIDTPSDECRMRVRNRPINPRGWNELIDLWKQKYKPDERDIIISGEKE